MSVACRPAVNPRRRASYLAFCSEFQPSVQSVVAVCYYSLVPLDTSPEAMRAQTEAQRRLGGAQRFRTTCMMSQTLRDLAVARIRSMHPELDERGVRDRLLADLYDFRRIT